MKILKYEDLCMGKLYMKLNSDHYLCLTNYFYIREITPYRKKTRSYVGNKIEDCYYVPADTRAEFIEIGSVE
jgi:hypothetical protein